jgi:hypothetical protein
MHGGDRPPMSGKRRANRQDAPQPMVAIKMRLEPSSAKEIFDMIAHNSAGDAAKSRTTFIQARPLSRACLAGETDEDQAEIGKDLIISMILRVNFRLVCLAPPQQRLIHRSSH